MTPALVWFRQDLRIQDNPALAAAVERGGPIIPFYVLDDAGEGRWAAGAASRWWLHHSLASLEASLRERGSRLILLCGESSERVEALAHSSGAGAVFWNRRYEPSVVVRDKGIKASLLAAGLEAKSFNGSVLFEPHTVANRQGGPFQVFTPYWRRCLELAVDEPLRLAMGPFAPPPVWPGSLQLERLGLLPKVRWDAGLSETWEPGEPAAAAGLKRFVGRSLGPYATDRDYPQLDGTSRLSPRLHFGELGPRQIWSAIKALSRQSGVFPSGKGAQVFLKELGWREFAHHLLYHFPTTPRSPLREEFRRFPWADDPGKTLLAAWQQGRTGYPIVDAGMRQLWRTGWMHNRVRMISGSFLVKHLRLSWNHGADWFWDTLVDADLANNTLGWQWTAGCGADAAPFFRIFAPVVQGKRFDPEGAYVKRWVPELAALAPEYIHRPWTAPLALLKAAGVALGSNYPFPVVDHAQARAAALAAYASLRPGAPA